MSGATAWKPAAASAPSWWRQEYQDSGKPWHRSTTGPLPCSAMLRRMPLVSTIRCVGSFMGPSLCGVGERLQPRHERHKRQEWRDQQMTPVHCSAPFLRCSLVRFGFQGALFLADERLEGLGLGAAQLFDGVGNLEPRSLRILAKGAERPPQVGKMFDRVLRDAAGESAAAPFLVRDLLVAHLPAKHPAEGR